MIYLIYDPGEDTSYLLLETTNGTAPILGVCTYVFSSSNTFSHWTKSIICRTSDYEQIADLDPTNLTVLDDYKIMYSTNTLEEYFDYIDEHPELLL